MTRQVNNVIIRVTCHGTIATIGLPIVTTVPADGTGDFLDEMWIGTPLPVESWIYNDDHYVDFSPEPFWQEFSEFQRFLHVRGFLQVPDAAARKFRWMCDRCSSGSVEATTTTLQVLLWEMHSNYLRSGISNEISIPLDRFRKLITRP